MTDDWSTWKAAEIRALMSSEYVRSPVAIDRENGVLQVHFAVQLPGYCDEITIDIEAI